DRPVQQELVDDAESRIAERHPCRSSFSPSSPVTTSPRAFHQEGATWRVCESHKFLVPRVPLRLSNGRSRSQVREQCGSRCTPAAYATAMPLLRKGCFRTFRIREFPVTKSRAQLTRSAPACKVGKWARRSASVGTAVIADLATTAAAETSSLACADRLR